MVSGAGTGGLWADVSRGAELRLFLLKTPRNNQTEQCGAVAVTGVVVVVFGVEVFSLLDAVEYPALWDCRTQNPGRRCLEELE